MGQAKYRKEHEANYGKPSMVRGLIISSPVKVDDKGVMEIAAGLDPQDLRSSLLYWDRLAWPTGAISFGPNQDATYLLDAGILTMPSYRVGGRDAELVLRPQLLALAELNQSQPGVWSLGQSENSVIMSSGAGVEGSGTLLSLLRSLPVPSNEASLAEILEFKQRRRDELLAFRTHLEAMVKEIESASDSSAALQAQLKRLDEACATLIATSREWQIPFKMSDLKVSFNFDLAKAGADAVKAWVTAGAIDLGITAKAVAATAGAVSSQFTVKSDVSLRSFKRTASPFSYVHHARQQRLLK